MLRLAHPPGHEAERRYAADVVLKELLGLEYTPVTTGDRVEITIPGDAERRLVLADVLFQTPMTSRLTERPLPEPPLPVFDLETAGVDARVVTPLLPVIFGEELAPGEFARTSASEIELGLDVFGSAFFMLTRLEERTLPERDEHARFPAAASLALRAGFLDRPIVNEYAEVLWWALQSLWPGLERRRRSFRLLVSHDVDHPRWNVAADRSLVRATTGDLLRRRDAGLALRRLRSVLPPRGPDVYDTFEWIMDASESRGLGDAFYFMAGAGGELDGAYSIDDAPIRALLRRIAGRGHELGLHPSYETFRDAGRMQSELGSLLRACGEEGIVQEEWGGRQHFLRWQAPTTWRIYESSGLAYDTTLTFADRAGFRSGACCEYTPFDLEQRRPLRLRERPLVAMEGSLFSYEGLSLANARERLVELKRRCRLFDGDFTLLWHNSSLLARGERRLYLDVLDA